MKEQMIRDVQALRLELRQITDSLIAVYKEHKDARLKLKDQKSAAESAETILIYEESRNPASDLKSGKNAEERKLALDYFLSKARDGKLSSFIACVQAAESELSDLDAEIKSLESKISAIKAELSGCIAILGVLSA